MPSEATIKRFMLRAREAAKHSTYPKQSIGAVLVYGNKILATGYNTNKTNPTQKRYNIERGYDQNVKNNGICHAEMQILLKTKFLDIDWDKTTLYVYRELKNGTIGCAKPCPACEKAIKERGITSVYYTTSGIPYNFMNLQRRESMRDYKIVNDHFAVINGEEVDINSMSFSNLMIQDESDKAIKEAVRHFLNFRPRCIDSETDSRFFYSKAQLKDFLKQYKNKKGDMKRIKCKVITDDVGEFFCYEIYRERRNSRNGN